MLSPQDLAAVDLIPGLVKAGVKSFKIEGRLKSPEYVAAVTRVYRKALDAVIEGTEVDLDEQGAGGDPILFDAAEQLRDEMRGGGLSTKWVPFRGGHEIPMPVLEELGRFLSTTAY